MGWQDRSYYRDEGYGGSPIGGRLRMMSVVTWLIIINAVFFLADSILGSSQRGAAIAPYLWGYFSLEKAFESFQIWRLITFQFLHGDIFHIFFNCLVIYFFGPMVESYLGSRRFLAFYLLGGIGGAVLFTVIALTIPGLILPEDIAPDVVPLIGASAGVFAILVGAAVIAPNQRVMLLIPPIPMQLKTLAYVFLGIAVVSVLVGSRNAGGEAAHIGGAAVGYLFIKRANLLNWVDMFGGGGRFSPGNLRDALEEKRESGRRQREQSRQAEVDRILDKVHREGLASLTEKEKRILRRETEQKRDR